MWVCEKCGTMKIYQYDRCIVCSLSGEEAQDSRRAEIPHHFLPTVEYDVPSPQVGMPRRFSIGTMMIITFFFALLFGVLKMLGVPPMAFVAITLFVAGVAACQAILYGGKNPRKASIVGGIVIFGVLFLLAALVAGYREGNVFRYITLSPCTIFSVVFAGGLLGYAAGGLVAAIFLVRKEPDNDPPEEQAERSR